MVTLLAACSDDGSSSSSNLVKVEGLVGAKGFSNAQVVVNTITESGQINISDDGLYVGNRESTDSKSRFTARVVSDEVLMFIARGQIADVDVDSNNKATTRLCQLASGCGVYELDTDTTTHYGLGEYYPEVSGFEWRSTVYTVNKGSHNNINPITTLAAGYAYQYDVLNYSNDPITDATLVALAQNEVFTAYDVVLANSQISNLLGLGDIIGEEPVNLNKVYKFKENTPEIRNQIRYGALIGAFQQKELAYRLIKMPSEDDFLTLVMEEFNNDAGQFYYKPGSEGRLLTLSELYESAYKNLELIYSNVKNIQAKAAIKLVISDLKIETTYAQSQALDTKTRVKPDSLSVLLTSTEKAEFDLGLEKTKEFVNSLLTFEDTFWQSGYKAEIDTYLDFLKTLSDEHQANLNEVIDEFKHIQDYYVHCILGGSDCVSRFSDLESRKVSFNSSTGVLVISNGVGGNITVSQELANLSFIEDNDSLSSSNAVDVFITGSIEKNGLILNLEHDYGTIDESLTTVEGEAAVEDEIEVPSSMRIYYSEAVTSINPNLEIQGYELIWGKFELYDNAALNTENETELSGAFRIFYRGLRDPQNTINSDLRFNIEDWVLSSTISDNVDDLNSFDSEKTEILITGASSNPSEYYPDSEFSSFNGFFESNEDNDALGSVESGLITYVQGTESVPVGDSTISVKTVDFMNSLGEDIRYRFYPNERVEDKLDVNQNGRFDDTVDLHRIEECQLTETGVVVSCGPKTKIFAKRDVQSTINELWKLGLFQRVTVPGVGTYYVDFPKAADAQGCYDLSSLESEKIMDGTLIESQVLGLDTVNVYAEISLESDQQVSLPKTLVSISIIAPTKDKYQVNAALSHNYSTSTSESTGIVLGSGSSASVLAVSYDTSSDFEDFGNVTISKSGVILSDALFGVVEDQDISAFLTQSYDPASVQYKIIENEEGVAERCILATGENYVKDASDAEEVFFINYRDVIYATARPEGDNGVWTIRYIDGTWLIPSDGSSTSGIGW